MTFLGQSKWITVNGDHAESQLEQHLSFLASSPSFRWLEGTDLLSDWITCWFFYLLKQNWLIVCVFLALSLGQMNQKWKTDPAVKHWLLHRCLEQSLRSAAPPVLPLTRFHNKTFKRSRPERKQAGSCFPLLTGSGCSGWSELWNIITAWHRGSVFHRSRLLFGDNLTSGQEQEILWMDTVFFFQITAILSSNLIQN